MESSPSTGKVLTGTRNQPNQQPGEAPSKDPRGHTTQLCCFSVKARTDTDFQVDQTSHLRKCCKTLTWPKQGWKQFCFLKIAVTNKIAIQTECYQSLQGHDTQYSAAFPITMAGTPFFSGVQKPQPHKFLAFSQIANLNCSFS